MKDQRKEAVEDATETRTLEQQGPAVASIDDTQRMRRLTAQEIEQLLKDREPGQ